MEGVKKSLQVTLENCEFAKEFHYFVTVQLDGEGEKVMHTETIMREFSDGQTSLLR
jgi:hypothetical protein